MNPEIQWSSNVLSRTTVVQFLLTSNIILLQLANYLYLQFLKPSKLYRNESFFWKLSWIFCVTTFCCTESSIHWIQVLPIWIQKLMNSTVCFLTPVFHITCSMNPKSSSTWNESLRSFCSLSSRSVLYLIPN